MDVFDNMRDKLLSYFNTNDEISSDWIKINDNKTECGWTIEDFPYNIGVDENLTDPHCWKCVSVNQCWFKNEEEKKPEHFDYSKYSFTQIPKSKRGLYHPNCHCKEKAMNVPRLKDIKILLDIGKIFYFFKDKTGLFNSWGYKNSDKDDFISNFKELVKDAYRRGNYQLEQHDKSGYKINLFITIYGTNEKRGKEYELKTAFIIFPKGTIRCVTLIGGWR